LRELFKISPDRFRIIVFTNILKRYIQSGLETLDLPAEAVTTFDWWCADAYRRFVSNKLPWNTETKSFDFQAIRSAIANLMTSNHKLIGSLDFVLVDEGQDLTPEAFQILRRLTRHLTVFADPQQQIFEEGAAEQEILSQLGLKRRNATLLSAYRNSPDVAKLASYFISDSEKQREYLAQIKNTNAVRECPLVFVANSEQSEIDRLAEVIRTRQGMTHRVGIIVPQRRQVFGFATGLAERGVEVEKALNQLKSSDPTVLNFDSDLPKIASYHSAKGLAFDSVLLPRLTKAAFSWLRPQVRERLLFVGISRATQWVYLSTVQGKEMEEFSILWRAVERQHLIVQKQQDIKSTASMVKDDDSYSVI